MREVKGSCIMFCGKSQRFYNYDDLYLDEYGYYQDADGNYVYLWEMESEEDTKFRLIEGLRSVGIECKSVTIKWSDLNAATRSCECVVRVCESLTESELYIEGLSSSDVVESSLEFSLEL
jgi:hypothetical protein